MHKESILHKDTFARGSLLYEETFTDIEISFYLLHFLFIITTDIFLVSVVLLLVLFQLINFIRYIFF